MRSPETMYSSFRFSISSTIRLERIQILSQKSLRFEILLGLLSLLQKVVTDHIFFSSSKRYFVWLQVLQRPSFYGLVFITYFISLISIHSLIYVHLFKSLYLDYLLRVSDPHPIWQLLRIYNNLLFASDSKLLNICWKSSYFEIIIIWPLFSDCC